MITFCISTFNNLPYLKIAIDSVRRNSHYKDAPFIIHAENCDDGTVEALFQGTQVQVDTILDWCHEGPERAIVSGIEVNIINSIKDFDSFSII